MPRPSGRFSTDNNSFMQGQQSVKRPVQRTEEIPNSTPNQQAVQNTPELQPKILNRKPIFDLDEPECVIIKVGNHHGSTPKYVKSSSLTIYTTEEEKQLVEELASSYNLSKSQFIRSLILNTKKRGE